MPPRLSKRQQRELEELQALQASPVVEEPSAEEESDDDVQEQPVASGFAALMQSQGDDEESDEEETSPKPSKVKKKKKKKKPTGPTKQLASLEPDSVPAAVSTPKATESSPPSGALSKKEKKAIKKQKAKAAKDDGDDLDKALAELSLKHPELKQSAQNATIPKASNTFFSLLAVSLQHLDSEAEMRKFFGSQVISASKASSSSSTPRRQPTIARSNLTRPQPTWWPASHRQGLSSRALTAEEIDDDHDRHQQSPVAGEKYWTVEYSKKYRGLTKAFIEMVMSGDPNGLFNLLRSFPYHADTLLQLSEVYFHREEHSTASDFIDRALFTYERAFVGSLNFQTGTNRLTFDRVENRPFFLAVHRQVSDLQRRGCVRTAFEFARLLYGLDPSTDPHGALLHLDFLSIKSGMSKWLIDMWDAQCSFNDDAWKERPHVKALPGWAYARALAMYIHEEIHDHTRSTEALSEAIRAFPSVVPLLADKADVSLTGDIRSHPAFRIHPDASSLSNSSDAILHLLSHLYAQRSFSLWKPKQRAEWFANTVISVTPSLPPKQTTTPGSKFAPSLALFHELYSTPSVAHSVYRHVMVLETVSRAGRLFGFLPSHVTGARQLACDPLPPPTRVNEYDSDFFQGAEDPFSVRLGSRRDNQRLLERLIPDPVFRRQLQDFFAANPHFAQRFPGGILEFAQIAGQMPEEDLEDLMLAVVDGAQDGAANDRMPGQMPGDDMLGFREQLAHAGGPEDEEHDENIADGAQEQDEEEDDDDEDNGVAPLPVRLLRNVLNRFWGAAPATESSDEEEENPQLRDEAGVD